jgi:hypothetical protein
MTQLYVHKATDKFVSRKTAYVISKCRLSGTTIIVKPTPDEDGWWQTVCHDHGRYMTHATLKLARSHSSVPEWCEFCHHKIWDECGPFCGEECTLTATSGDEPENKHSQALKSGIIYDYHEALTGEYVDTAYAGAVKRYVLEFRFNAATLDGEFV